MEIIPLKERKSDAHCWFCGTTKAVKYKEEILNPCPIAENRYIGIFVCSKCAALHEMHCKGYWDKKYNLA